MITDADLAKYAPDRTRTHKPTLIDKANEVVDIRDIYNEMQSGSLAPSGEYSSWKIWCPFGYEHADGGLDKNCRLYPPTHIYCWASHGVIRPTYLYARWKGMPQKKAAEELLKARGFLTERNFRAWWNELVDERDQKQHSRLGAQTFAIQALQQALATDSLYQQEEYSEPVRSAWVLVLAKLDLLWQKPETDAIILNQWLTRSTARIKAAAQEASHV